MLNLASNELNLANLHLAVAEASSGCSCGSDHSESLRLAFVRFCKAKVLLAPLPADLQEQVNPELEALNNRLQHAYKEES